MKLRVADQAQRCADVIDAWWRVNRDRSPNLFDDELTHILALLPSMPKMGEVFRARDPVVYRVLMRKTRHYVYYTVDEVAGLVEVQSVWGTPLRDTPDL